MARDGSGSGGGGAALEAGLVKEIAGGSEPALAQLYDRYARVLFSLIVRVLKDARDAEEVLQEVFLQVWKLAGRFDPERGNTYRWLVTLARSRAIDRLRSKNFKTRRAAESSLDMLETTLEPTEPTEPTEPSQLDAVLMLERADHVRRGLATISPEQLEVMRLAYFLGFTQSEIARELEIPLGTVKSRMRQGLIALRGRLAEESTS
jgi:RNA polymerase sigma-70 factor (ECF subfamily)